MGLRRVEGEVRPWYCGEEVRGRGTAESRWPLVVSRGGNTILQ